MYSPKTFTLPALDGLSSRQVEEHLKLYQGYVTNLNKLNDTLAALMKDSEANAYALAEVKRRLGFEFNGMRLHEYYFEQFEGGSEPASSKLKALIEAQWGSFDAWMNEFKAVAKMRGVGWAILYRDNRAGTLHNVWVSDHELGHLGGQDILLACDVWEHAYLLDYLPSQRGDYLEAFFKNVNWAVVEGRV